MATARPAMMLWTIVLAAAAALLLVAAGVFMMAMPGRGYAGPRVPLTEDQEAIRQKLETHVRVLAGEIGERNDGRYAALEAAARYVDGVLTGLGYGVVSQDIASGPLTFRNLEATRRGQTRPDEIVLVGGHYDCVEGTPGADDNASGTAALLGLARLLADGRFARTIRFVAFVNEEPPYFNTEFMGSRIYAQAAARRGDNIVAMISLETIGYYATEPGTQRYPFPFSLFYPDRGDFLGFVGNLASRHLVRRSVAAFRRHARLPSEGVAAPGWMPGVFWSDHASFWIHGYPAIMITDTAPFRNPDYHTSQDTPDKLDYGRMARAVDGLAHVVRDLAGPSR